MSTAEAQKPSVRQRGFTLTRVLDASPDEVFRAWTDPDHLGWYFNDTMPVPDEPTTVDLRPGGEWRQMMVIDDETRFVTGGLYLEIDPPNRLVFAWGAVGGWPKLDPAKPQDSPTVVMTLTGMGTRTAMTIDLDLPESMDEATAKEWMESHVMQGWSDTIDRVVAAYEGSPTTSG